VFFLPLNEDNARSKVPLNDLGLLAAESSVDVRDICFFFAFDEPVMELNNRDSRGVSDFVCFLLSESERRNRNVWFSFAGFSFVAGVAGAVSFAGVSF